MINNNLKINLIGLNEVSILNLLKLLKIKTYYLKIIIKFIHNKDIINKKIFKIIKNISHIKINKIIKEILNKDNTIKWLIKINKNNYIETVAIPNKKNQYTLCMSSQVGCILNCSFCCTGKQGFTQNLKPSEFLSQIYQANKKINLLFNKKKISNIVMMGMGEPLLNTNNLISSLKIIYSKYTYNISKKKITISTSGIIPEIKNIIKYKIPLALSLHLTNNKERSKIMPINKKYSIKNLMTICKLYSITEKLTIEYIMIKNLNDSIKDAIKLSNLLSDIKCKICLIPFNDFAGTKYMSSNKKQILIFRDILQKNGKITTIRKRYGYEINAACGQLNSLIKKI